MFVWWKKSLSVRNLLDKKSTSLITTCEVTIDPPGSKKSDCTKLADKQSRKLLQRSGQGVDLAPFNLPFRV